MSGCFSPCSLTRLKRVYKGRGKGSSSAFLRWSASRSAKKAEFLAASLESLKPHLCRSGPYPQLPKRLRANRVATFLVKIRSACPFAISTMAEEEPEELPPCLWETKNEEGEWSEGTVDEGFPVGEVRDRDDDSFNALPNSSPSPPLP